MTDIQQNTLLTALLSYGKYGQAIITISHKQRHNRTTMAYSITVSSNEHESAVGLDFEYLSDEYKVVRVCRFQCIGWVLDAVAQVEHEARSGSVWTNPEESVKALMQFPCIPEHLARELIAAESTEEKLNLVWNYISDDEKNTAITINFDYYHNFWPSFQLYSRIIALHMTNTSKQEDLKEKMEHLKSETTTNSNFLHPIKNNPANPIHPNTKIKYIYYDNSSRIVIYDIPKPPLTTEYPDYILV